MTQYETKIVVFNPTTNKTKYAADIYLRTVHHIEHSSWKRVRCGNGGYTKQEAYQDAINHLAEVVEDEPELDMISKSEYCRNSNPYISTTKGSTNDN